MGHLHDLVTLAMLCHYVSYVQCTCNFGINIMYNNLIMYDILLPGNYRLYVNIKSGYCRYVPFYVLWYIEKGKEYSFQNI